LDEAHAAHVSCEDEHDVVAGNCSATRVELAQIELEVGCAIVHLEPLGDWLHIDTGDRGAAIQQARDEMTSDESTGTCNHRWSLQDLICLEAQVDRQRASRSVWSDVMRFAPLTSSSRAARRGSPHLPSRALRVERAGSPRRGAR